nr:HTH-type transcriptional activator IlvY [uncultured Holophaga sp.]
MELRSLELFLNLTETLHFSRTAEAMAASPSALSRAIQRLEQEVGCTLLERTNRRVKLTPAGERMRDFAFRLVQEWHGLCQDLRAAGTPVQGRLKLYCSVTASYLLLPALLGRFSARHPHLEVGLQTGDSALAIGKVLADEADMAIAARPSALSAKLHFMSLQQIPLVFIAPRAPGPIARWLQGEEPDWEHLPIILAEQGLARKRCDQWFRNKGIHPNIYAEVAGHEAIVSMVSFGCGVGLVPEAVINQSPLARKIRVIEAHPTFKPFDVGLCVQKRRLEDPLIKAFWEIAQQGLG